MLPTMVAVPDGPGSLGHSSGNKSILQRNGSVYRIVEFWKKVHLIIFFGKGNVWHLCKPNGIQKFSGWLI